MLPVPQMQDTTSFKQKLEKTQSFEGGQNNRRWHNIYQSQMNQVI